MLLDRRRPARIAGLAALAVTAMLLAAPAAHGAATSASLVGTIGTLSFDGADDTVTITNAAGSLDHGQTGGAFASSKDWDTATPGEQALPADGTATVVVNGGDGADSITAPLGLLPPNPPGTPEVLKATLNGEGGSDLLIGSRAADDLRGGTGDDRLVGFAGNDDMEGGDGNDTLVWSNGDNNDTMDGDAGNDGVEVNGAPIAGDVFTIQPGAAPSRIRLDRSNLVPFNLDIGTAEAMALNSLGGDDVIGVGEVGAFRVAADGGSGNDSLNGSSGAETFLGSSGNDAINPGPGIDVVSGDEGDDVIVARDQTVDFTRCGSGTDQATADPVALDAVLEDCETVDRPPVTEPSAPPPTDLSAPPATGVSPPGPVKISATAVKISAATVKIKKRKGRIVFACPATSAISCRVSLNLLAGSRIGQINVVVVLARTSFELQRGETRGVLIKVPKGADGLADAKGKLSGLAVATTTGGPSSTSASTTQKLTLDFGKPKRKTKK